MPPIGFLWLVAYVAVLLYHSWQKGPYIPRTPQQSARDSKRIALWKAKGDALRRIARGDGESLEVGVLRLPVKDRVIVSSPVYLYESRSRRRADLGKVGSRTLIWNDHASSGKSVTIALTDRGTLELTEERFIFRSERQRREFPLGELSYFCTTWSSIAIAARGRYGASYFRGFSDSHMQVRVEPEAEDTWLAENFAFTVRENQISQIVMWLMRQPTSPDPA